MIEIGITKLDYALLLEDWKLEIVYPKDTAMKIKESLERRAEKLFLEKKGDLKTIRIRFYELGQGCVSWIETFCTFQFTFRSHGLSKCEGTLKLRVQAIIDRGINENVTPQEV